MEGNIFVAIDAKNQVVMTGNDGKGADIDVKGIGARFDFVQYPLIKLLFSSTN